MKQLYPNAQVTIGPVIEDGFYYDFAYERPFTPEDLAAIEDEHARARQGRPQGHAAGHARATTPCSSSTTRGENYKAEIIASIPADEDIGLYGQGGLGRPVPRSARAEHGQAAGVQAHEDRRRLLARRLAQRDAPAHLRHGVAGRQAAQGLPHAPGRSGEARPPQDRQGTGPVPLPGRGAGRGVLASQGLDACSRR